jgi:hypothetical protein
MKTEQSLNDLYPISDVFPTCYEYNSSVNIETMLRSKRRVITFRLPAVADTFLRHGSTQRGGPQSLLFRANRAAKFTRCNRA